MVFYYGRPKKLTRNTILGFIHHQAPHLQDGKYNFYFRRKVLEIY